MEKAASKILAGKLLPYDIQHDLEYVSQCVDHTVSRETFSLYKDPANDLLLTWPQPGPDELPSYYESENYISHTDAEESVMDKVYQFVKKFALRNKLNLIHKVSRVSPGRLLDVGCGTGDFLAVCHKAGWKVTGVEPNLKARKMAGEKISAQKQLFDSLENLTLQKGKKFDVITMWHVLEHVPDLKEYILMLRSFLQPDGVLCIAVPNHKSYDATHYGSFWAAYDVPRHLWHFSREAMHELFAKFDMEVEKEVPMLFDSFYVSLLSEKYKRGKTALIPALYHGLLSNIRANRSGEYSSIIYLVKNTK